MSRTISRSSLPLVAALLLAVLVLPHPPVVSLPSSWSPPTGGGGPDQGVEALGQPPIFVNGEAVEPSALATLKNGEVTQVSVRQPVRSRSGNDYELEVTMEALARGCHFDFYLRFTPSGLIRIEGLQNYEEPCSPSLLKRALRDLTKVRVEKAIRTLWHLGGDDGALELVAVAARGLIEVLQSWKFW